jgi:membrane-anchored protein YejM (alkaline phosphatase superfamily)
MALGLASVRACLISSPAAKAAAGLVFLGLCACSGSRESPNVVVITVDTLRADSLGVYGNPEGHSPHIDAFAQNAVVFEDAVTAIGTTFPSHASMFTGLYPKNHGVRWNGDGLDDRSTTLAEVLQEAGYETAAFVSPGSMLERGGLQQGFSVTDEFWTRESPRYVRAGDEVNARARSWLDSRSDERFFLWLHYFEPHTPYEVSEYSKTKHASAGYQGVFSHGASPAALRKLGTEVPWSEAERAAIRALYDGGVRAADRLVGSEQSHRSVGKRGFLIKFGDGSPPIPPRNVIKIAVFR